MTENHASNAAKIRALKTALVSLLERDRDEGIRLSKVQEASSYLREAFQVALNEGTQQLLLENYDTSQNLLPWIEDIYEHWKTIDSAFQNTLILAYNGNIPPRSLLLDSIHEDLKHLVGEPLSALYTRFHELWRKHLDSHPWDAFLVRRNTHADAEQFNNMLKLLVHGDHLDVEDAIEGLTGPLRYVFAQYIDKISEPVDLLEESLWMRPEIVVINDFWRRSPHFRLLDVLRRKSGSKLAGSFARVRDFFIGEEAIGYPNPAEKIVTEIGVVSSDEKETFLRCLMLHPDQAVRRYATTNVDIEGFWKVVTPEAVPCATVLSMLEKVAGSTHFDENFQKIFFNSIYRRLLMLTSRSDVLYARGIVRIFAQLPFFMEDSYFERLRMILDYLAAKERYYQINDSFLDEFVRKLKREKERLGRLEAQPPSFTSVPPVVLRKLARDGHHWYELAMHPMVKIARETVPHINTPNRAVRIANNPVVNQEVLRAVGKRRSLFHTLPAKIALLSNPRTPPGVSLDYVADLGKGDVETLLRRGSVHPELRIFLRRKYNQ